MNQSVLLLGTLKRTAVFTLLCAFVAACGGNVVGPQEEVAMEGLDPMEIVEETPYEEPLGEVPAGEEGVVEETPEVVASAPALDAEDYKVVLDVTQNIKLHHTGTLKVWIGQDKYTPNRAEDKVRDSATIPADEITNYARITPYAPEFEVDPKEALIRIVPGGSSAMFTLTPQKEGTYEIGATIELFDNAEFVGVGIPKTTENLLVTVGVNHKESFKDHATQLLNPLWDGFVKFWGAFVAFFFAALLFVIRRYIKKKTKYDDGTTPSEE